MEPKEFSSSHKCPQIVQDKKCKYDVEDQREWKSKKEDDMKFVEEEEDNQDIYQELQWKSRLKDVKAGSIAISQNPKAKQICEGFRINHMIMCDADTGQILWKSGKWDIEIYKKEQSAFIPAKILECRAVSREVNFTSKESIDNLRLEQKVYFQGKCLEEWRFHFGYVIPESTNSWQQTIESAGEGQMRNAQVLNGKLTIETAFYSGSMFISKCLVRIFYV